jgi:hypothetical protein
MPPVKTNGVTRFALIFLRFYPVFLLGMLLLRFVRTLT